MIRSRSNPWLLVFLLLVIVTSRWLPVHSHVGAAHNHDGAHHHHAAEIHAHQAMPRHADAIDIGHAAAHERVGEVDLQQDQLARHAPLADDLPDVVPSAHRNDVPRQSLAQVFPLGPQFHPALRPPPHRGEPRAPPFTA